MARPARKRPTPAAAPPVRKRVRTGPPKDDLPEALPEDDADEIGDDAGEVEDDEAGEPVAEDEGGFEPAPKRTTRKPVKSGKPPAFKALSSMEKDAKESFGGPYIVRASRSDQGTTYIDTGVMPFDLGTMGGVPEDRVTMFVGWESGGKSTMSLLTAAGAQRKYDQEAVAVIDAEHTLDLDWAEKQGCDLERLYVAEPPKAEEAIDMVQGFAATKEVSLIIVDSLPALVPETTATSSAFDQQVADRARLIGKMCSKINVAIAEAKGQRRKLTVVFINQWRSVIGGYTKGPTKQMPGGMQPKYISSVIAEIGKLEKVGASDDEAMVLAQRNTHNFRLIKSKVGNSLKQGEWDMIRDPSHPLGEGAIDDYLSTLTYAKRFGIYNGVGTKQSFAKQTGVDRTFKNKEAAIKFFYDEPDLYRNVKREVVKEWRTRSNLPPIPNDGYLLGYV